jgi:hypothetical protein
LGGWGGCFGGCYAPARGFRVGASLFADLGGSAWSAFFGHMLNRTRRAGPPTGPGFM